MKKGYDPMKLIHCADLHLDSPMESNLSAEKARERKGEILATFANGATGTFLTSTGEYPGTNRLEIVGSKGSLILEQNRLTWHRLSMDEREYRHSPKGTENKMNTVTYEDEPVHGHCEILKNFARSILFGEDLIARGEEGAHQLALTNAAYLSAWTGK